MTFSWSGCCCHRVAGVHSLWSWSPEIRSIYSRRTLWKSILYGKDGEEALRDSDLLYARWLLPRGKGGLLERQLAWASTWSVVGSTGKTPADRLSRCEFTLARTYLLSMPTKVSIQTERKHPMGRAEGMYQLRFFQGYSINQLLFLFHLTGMWSSIFSIDVMYVWNLAADSEDFWCRWTRDRVNDIGEIFNFFAPLVYIAYVLWRCLTHKKMLSKWESKRWGK